MPYGILPSEEVKGLKLVCETENVGNFILYQDIPPGSGECKAQIPRYFMSAYTEKKSGARMENVPWNSSKGGAVLVHFFSQCMIEGGVLICRVAYEDLSYPKFHTWYIVEIGHYRLLIFVLASA